MATRVVHGAEEAGMFKTRPVVDHLGVEVFGFDFAKPTDPQEIREIRRLADRHFLLLFRDQPINEDDQVRFTRAMGTIIPPVEPHFTSTTNPMILRLGNVSEDGRHLPPDSAAAQYTYVPERWHSDGSYKPVPNYLSILQARNVPDEGGETGFASMAAAYAALDDETKAFIADKRMEHPYPRGEVKGVSLSGTKLAIETHPLVRILPEDQKALFLSPFGGHVLDMVEAQSDALVDRLFTFATSDRFSYYHRWRVGDTIIWNNRGLVHRAMPWDRAKYRRLMQRTEISGAGVN